MTSSTEGRTPMPRPAATINENGAWCWFQDERDLVDPVNNTLLVGSVAAPKGPGGERRGGNIEVAVLDLASGRSRVHVLHHRLEPDDHDAPALLIRPDGRYLAMYARHKTDNYSRWRISVRPHDASEWGPEERFDWTETSSPPTTTRATSTTASITATSATTPCTTPRGGWWPNR